MAKKISQLPAAGTLDGNEFLEVDKSGVSGKTTAQEIANLGGSGNIKVIGQQFSAVSNVGATLSTLHSIPIQPGKLAVDGETIYGEFVGRCLTQGGMSSQLVLRFGNNNIDPDPVLYDTGQFPMSSNPRAFYFYFTLMRISETTAKVFTSAIINGVGLVDGYQEITGLDFSLISYVFLTGQVFDVGSGSDKITSHFSKVFFAPAA